MTETASSDRQKTRIVILGAGFAGVYVLKRLHREYHDRDDVEIILVNPTNYFLFTPLLHEVATGNLWAEDVVSPIRKEVGCCLNFRHARAEEVVLAEKKVKTTAGEVVFDYLVIAIGSETVFYDVPGAREHAFTLKTLTDAVILKNHSIRLFERASIEPDRARRRELLHFVVVGGGPTGVELSAEMSSYFYDNFIDYYPDEVIDDVRITLVQRAGTLVPYFSKKVTDEVHRVLESDRIDIRFNTEVTEVGPKHVVLKSGERLAAHTVVWAAGVAPREMRFDMPVSHNKKGGLMVNSNLQLDGHPDVFALGDKSEFKQNGAPLPALAQVAVRQAKTASENIIRSIAGAPLRPFRYRHKGDLISLGPWRAAGEAKGMFRLTGVPAWIIWRLVYLSKMLTFRKKVQVGIDWLLNMFSPRDISEFYDHEEVLKRAGCPHRRPTVDRKASSEAGEKGPQ